jgi:Glycosyl transferase family 2
MKVSAVIPTFNHRAHLGRAIDSILAQTVPVDEIVLVDDGSTDGSAEFVESRYGNRVRIVRQTNTGVSGARRRGVQESRGEWIEFLDSDDEWEPGRNELFLLAAERVGADVAWIFGNMRVVTDNGPGLTLFEEFGLTVDETPHVFKDSLSVQHPFQFGLLQGSLIRRKVLIELDCFNEGLQHSEDFYAGVQVACRYKFAAVPAVVGKYYRTSDLTENSAMLKGLLGGDYFRARILAYGLLARNHGRRPWNLHHADAVRGLCQLMGKTGEVPRRLALQQFRYGSFSLKAIAYFCAVVAGRPGVQLWERVAAFRRKHLIRSKPATKPNGFQSAIEPFMKRG